jgi:hypothetical protein
MDVYDGSTGFCNGNDLFGDLVGGVGNGRRLRFLRSGA